MKDKRLWPIFGILIAAIPVTLFFQEEFRTAVIIPLAHFFWLASLFIDSIPQALVWVALLLVVLVIISANFFRVPKMRFKRDSGVMRRMGAVESWLEWIIQAEQGTYYRGRLAKRMMDMAIPIIAYTDRLSTTAVKRRIEDASLKLPPDVLSYLQQGLETLAWRSFYDPFLRIPFLKRKEDVAILTSGPIRLIEYLRQTFKGRVGR
ncbi:hypothetical protein HY229_02875 [Candidatus Acetothermia bacterium]|nr:hypothetical protein [Candidatus Acetothermia bacterium]MBI3643026.1 hypothetical protein [Candidatus Acetothermia bacterium]